MVRKVLIIGGGFGGVHAANLLADRLGPRRRIQITLVSDKAHFLFTPLLPNASTGDVSLENIEVPLRDVLRERVDIEMDTITEISVEKQVAFGAYEHDFDYLILAPGAVTHWDNHPEWAEHSLVCRAGQDATQIFEHLERAFLVASETGDESERRRWLTFVVAGAGPTGVSLLAELVAHVRANLLPVHPELARDLRFVLVEPNERLLPQMEEALGEICSKHFDHIGVEVRLGERVTKRNETEVEIDHVDVIQTHSFLWCGGVQPAPLVAASRLPTNPRGRVLVDSNLRCSSNHRIFVIGDCAASTAPWSAATARQQADIAAHNLAADLSGRSHRDWKYDYQGDIIPLGRRNAAVIFQGVTLEGRAAKALYRVIYTALVPSGMRKLGVFKDWWASNRKSRQRQLTAPKSKP